MVISENYSVKTGLADQYLRDLITILKERRDSWKKVGATRSGISSSIENIASGNSRDESMKQDITIFGSFAAGLDEPVSDLDVFCVGSSRTHYKSKTVEIMILAEYDLFGPLLVSELANHIRCYGVPLGSRPEWFDRAAIST